MFIGRESLVALETLAKTQVQIFPDACDVGIPDSPQKDHQIWKIAQELSKDFFMKRHQWSSGATREWFIPFEAERTIRGTDLYIGVRVKISRCSSKGRRWFSIDINRDTTEEYPFQEHPEKVSDVEKMYEKAHKEEVQKGLQNPNPNNEEK